MAPGAGSGRRILFRQKVSSQPYLLSSLVLACLLSYATGSAQTITIRLLNAKSGKPMRSRMVTVEWFGAELSSQISVDKDGVGRVLVPRGATQLLLMPGPRMGSEQYRISFMNCNETPSKLISVQAVITNGVVPGNVCKQRTTSARTGEIVFWALPRPFLDLQ